jgi:hypothetical protein
MSNNKQSSIEYFKTQIVDIVEDYKDGIITLNEYIIHINSTFEQAKAMHKEEMFEYIKQKYCIGHRSLEFHRLEFDKYYNETFGGNNDE